MMQTNTGYPSIDKPWLKYYDNPGNAENIQLKTCYERLVEATHEFRGFIALESLGVEFSYDALLQEIDRAASAFVNLGVGAGDVVAVTGVNVPQVVIDFYALNKIGAIPDLLDPRNNAKMLDYYLNQSSPKLLLAFDGCWGSVSRCLEERPDLKAVVFSPLDYFPSAKRIVAKITDPSLRIKVPFGAQVVSYRAFMRGSANSASASVSFEPNNVAAIVHTGGTTGKPKSVLLSNSNFEAVLRQIRSSPIGVEAGDVFLNVLVPFVAYGLTLGLHVPLCLGWRSVLIPKFEPSDMPDLAAKHMPQVVMGIQTYFVPLLNEDEIDYSTMKILLMGGMPTSKEFEQDANERIRSNGGSFCVSKGYSLTEASSCATCSFDVANKIGSNGIPLPETVVAAFDPVSGDELPFGEVGEICLQTPTTMLGYLNNPDATSEILQKDAQGNVWVHTGDLGYIDEDGFVFVVDRLKRMIIRQGYKVFPSEVENVLLSHPNVISAAVVEVSDPKDGKAPFAFVVCSEDTRDTLLIQELEAVLNESVLPVYATPVGICVVDVLPKTNIGKVDYRRLEQMASERVSHE